MVEIIFPFFCIEDCKEPKLRNLTVNTLINEAELQESTCNNFVPA